MRAAHPSTVHVSSLVTSYNPELDGRADPGEIIWTWVPYEEGDGRGKDRPLLIVARDAAEVYGLMLSSNAARADEADWLPLGHGAWDSEGRDSWVRLDRVLALGDGDIRREGTILDEARFSQVTDVLKASYDWG